MEELRDTAALPKYTEPIKRDAQKWHNIPSLGKSVKYYNCRL